MILIAQPAKNVLCRKTLCVTDSDAGTIRSLQRHALATHDSEFQLELRTSYFKWTIRLSKIKLIYIDDSKDMTLSKAIYLSVCHAAQ